MMKPSQEQKCHSSNYLCCHSSTSIAPPTSALMQGIGFILQHWTIKQQVDTYMFWTLAKNTKANGAARPFASKVRVNHLGVNIIQTNYLRRGGRHQTREPLVCRYRPTREICVDFYCWLPRYCWLLHGLAKHSYSNGPSSPAPTSFEHHILSHALLCQTYYGLMVDHNLPSNIFVTFPRTFPNSGALFITTLPTKQWQNWINGKIYEETHCHILEQLLSWWECSLSCS